MITFGHQIVKFIGFLPLLKTIRYEARFDISAGYLVHASSERGPTSWLWFYYMLWNWEFYFCSSLIRKCTRLIFCEIYIVILFIFLTVHSPIVIYRMFIKFVFGELYELRLTILRIKMGWMDKQKKRVWLKISHPGRVVYKQYVSLR